MVKPYLPIALELPYKKFKTQKRVKGGSARASGRHYCTIWGELSKRDKVVLILETYFCFTEIDQFLIRKTGFKLDPKTQPYLPIALALTDQD